VLKPLGGRAGQGVVACAAKQRPVCGRCWSWSPAADAAGDGAGLLPRLNRRRQAHSVGETVSPLGAIHTAGPLGPAGVRSNLGRGREPEGHQRLTTAERAICARGLGPRP